MKLNEKCMKDVLKYAVDNTKVTDNGVCYGCKIHDLQELLLPKYTMEESAYAIVKLRELGYIVLDCDKSWNHNDSISDVTYNGHLYLLS